MIPIMPTGKSTIPIRLGGNGLAPLNDPIVGDIGSEKKTVHTPYEARSIPPTIKAIRCFQYMRSIKITASSGSPPLTMVSRSETAGCINGDTMPVDYSTLT